MLTNELGEREEYYYVDNYMVENLSIEEAPAAATSLIQPNRPVLLKSPKIKYQLIGNDETTIVANCLEFAFPIEFAASKNQNKRATLLSCRLYTKQDDLLQETDCSLHSNITTITGVDGFITQANPQYFIQKTFIIGPNQSTFVIWFRDPSGTVIDLAPIEGECHFTLEMKLTF